MFQSILPIYLGKNKSSNTYYFLANKQGVGRFLKYTVYPYWCGSKDLADFLAFEDPPQQVMKEVFAFVIGELQIEVIPKARGRAERVIKTVVSDKPAQEKVGGEVHARPNSSSKIEPKSNGRKVGEQAGSSAAISQEKPNNCNPNVNDVSATSKSGRRTSSETARRLSVPTDSGSRSIRGLSSNGCIVGDAKSIVSSNNASTVTGTRRVPSDGILGDGGNDSKSVSTITTIDKSDNSSVDGSGSGRVKQKRSRRTKAAMLEAKANEK